MSHEIDVGAANPGKSIFFRTSMMGPMFMLGCISVFYMYNIAIVIQRESEIRVLRNTLNIDALAATDIVSVANPWDSEPLPIVLQTHVGVSPSRRPLGASVSIILDTHTLNPVGQIGGLVQFASPHSNIHIYVGVNSDVGEKYTRLFYNALHNSSVPEDTSVDLTALELASGVKQQTRFFRMAWHALHELQSGDRQRDQPGFVLLLHRSCVIDFKWDVSTLELGGNGFLLVYGDVTSHTLYNEVASHDLGIASGSIHRHRHSNAHAAQFHCSGSIMHALHIQQHS
jgi:hypothetical protein